MHSSIKFTKLCMGFLPVLMLVLIIGCGKKAEISINYTDAAKMAAIYEEARDTYNLELLDEIYAPDVIIHDPGSPEPLMGLKALKDYYNNSHAMFSDLKIKMGNTFISGDRIIWEWTFTGTNTGPMGALPATGKSVKFSGIAVDKIQNGKIIEEWVFFDRVNLYQQLGFTLMPPQ
ncbi:MAG: hypothetical protein CVT49_02860 [candidate division Zixibacteria bacterium HGW-Zixibacteria-1]|nr:MAG: hypothetical protein CVT49_02860 [candidate division Zixibacteria bacterium HGW-Zixibacteria-1]